MSITHILKFGILLKQGYNDVSHKDTTLAKRQKWWRRATYSQKIYNHLT